jgi:hypothetical protein
MSDSRDEDEVVVKVYCPECAAAFEGIAGAIYRCPHCMVEEKRKESPKADSPEAWRVECERAVYHANVLLRLARIPGGVGSAIAEMIRTAPRSEKDLANMPETALFQRIVLEADRLSPNDELLRVAVGYFSRHLIAMAPERRRMLEASITGAMMGFVMG